MDIEEIVVNTGVRLRRLRLDRGISRRQLADQTGVNPSVVSHAEKGRDARLSTWLKLFEGLGYDLRIETDEMCEEALDLIAEEADRRRRRRDEGLCTGKRRF